MTSAPATATVPPPVRRVRSLQIGSGWFAERAGGLDRYYVDLLRSLPEAGVDCNGLVIGSKQVEHDSHGSVVGYANAATPLMNRSIAVRRACKAAISSTSPDVIVTHFAPYALPLIGAHRLPTVVHFHGPWAAESAREGAGRVSVRLKHFIERTVYRRADRLIVLSHAFKDVLVRDYGITANRVSVIPGGVDVQRFASASSLERVEARARLGWPSDRPIVLAVRRLASRMGLERLIDAMAQVRSKVPEALCLIAGRGRLENALLEQIRRLSLQDSVKLVGFVADNELPLAYRAADVSIVPSEALEGFGLSAVESLASGTPVLVTRVGGLPEVVEPLSSQLLLPPADREAMASALVFSLRDPARLPSRDACLVYARTRFDWKAVSQQVADVYRQTANRAP